MMLTRPMKQVSVAATVLLAVSPALAGAEAGQAAHVNADWTLIGALAVIGLTVLLLAARESERRCIQTRFVVSRTRRGARQTPPASRSGDRN